MKRISVGIDEATGAEKFEIYDDSNNLVGYDLVYESEE
jgi:uncharacterized protein YcfJ